MPELDTLVTGVQTGPALEGSHGGHELIADQTEGAPLVAETSSMAALIDVNVGDPRNALEVLSRDPHTLTVLDVLAKENSQKKWGPLETKTEYSNAQSEWGKQMVGWADRLNIRNPELHAQVETIARFVTGNPIRLDQQDQIPIDWVAFHNAIRNGDTSNSIEGFISLLKSMPDIQTNIRGMKELSRIFGKDVHQKLFGKEAPEQVHERQNDWSRSVVEKAFEEGKIDELKRARLLKAVDRRAEDTGHLMRSIEIDSGFSASEKAKIQKILLTIPPSLLKNIGRIYKLGDSDFGAGCHSGGLKGISDIGIRSDTLDLNFYHGREGVTEGVFYHEIMGHGLRWFVNGQGNELKNELNALMSSVPERMLRKDTYSTDYLDDSPRVHQFNFDREGISSAVDEFWADRMGEYWARKALGVTISEHRVRDDVFSPEEQRYIDEVCEKTEAIFSRAVEKKKIHAEQDRKQQNTGLSRLGGGFFGSTRGLEKAA